MNLLQQQKLEDQYVMHTYGRKPVEFVRGKGIYLYDDEGKRYMDFLSGIGVISVGHGNPAVVAALQQQAERLLHVSNFFYIEGRGELAAQLNGLLAASKASQDSAWKTFFCNSGAEANEGAIKLARKYGNEKLQGAHTIITARKSFHGRTLVTTAATGQQAKQEVFYPMPAGFVHVPLNDIETLKNALDATGLQVPCAVMLECIQGEGGVWPCDFEYLQAVRKLTAERELLLIIDEVQTGFFRTGSYPFSFMHYDICPDVVTMAKGIGNGMPMGAFAAQGALGDLLQPGEHGSTFGGSSLAVAAARATIDELVSLEIAGKVAKVGARFASLLAELPLVNEVRGKGLMLAIQLDKPIADSAIKAALKEGLIINAIGDSILRFLPPLVVSDAQIDEALIILRSILAKEV